METYSGAGVNLSKARSTHLKIEKMLPRSKNVALGIGHYAGVVKANGKYLALHTDNVGTKTALALKTGIIEPTGVDAIAMNVNDMICVGARPVAIVDYLAMEEYSEEIVSGVMKGLAKGAKEAGADVIGGETSVEPGVINGYDLSATVMGTANRIMTGSKVKEGDVIIGLASSGIHSNGYSLIRKLIDSNKLSLGDYAKELMAPTKIYVKPVLSVLDNITGAAHITGGTFSKLRRITKFGITIKLPEPPEIFKVLERSGVSHREMHNVYNMGIGMVIFCRKKDGDRVLTKISKRLEAHKIGVVEKSGPIRVETYRGKRFSF
jgi:phosphoribosylformylglycinamidine cyclo-ligase